MKKLYGLLTLVLLSLAVGCVSRPALQVSESSEVLKGVSLSPRSFAAEDFQNFFVLAKRAGQVVSWAGPLEQLADPKGAPNVVMALSKTSRYTPVIITEPADAILSDSKKLVEARQTVVDFARLQKPAWLGLGNEVNITFEKTPQRYEAFVGWVKETAAEVKKISPTTNVFVTFQLERLRGLRGGLFGGTSNEEKNDWRLVQDLQDSLDAVALTTYPGLVYKNPSDIPDDYFQAIASRFQKPVLITEVGWFRTGPTGWGSSEQEQAEFINRLPELVTPLEPRFVIWSFLYDPNIEAPFSSMGLLDSKSETSPAWQAWLSVSF